MTEVNSCRLGNTEVKIILPNESVSRDIIIPKLSHGNRIIEIKNRGENLTDCDGVFTSNSGLVLGVTTADCAAICLTDGDRIGVVHAGWRGLSSGVVENMLANFDISRVQIYVSPFLHSFEIKKDFCYEAIAKKFGTEFFDEVAGEIIFRFKDALESILPVGTVFDSRSTDPSFDLPSYRRDGTEDRMITTVSFI